MNSRQLWIVAAGVAVIFLLLGIRLLFLGAWPTIPFMLADTALFAWALRQSRRSGEQSEHIRLDASGLELVRIAPYGQVRRNRLEPHWARVELERIGAHENRLWLLAGGRRLAVGSFLSPQERVEIAAVIEEGLQRFQRQGGAE